MTVIAFVPARGGSTRIPQKNLQLVGGQSLVSRTINAAFGVGMQPGGAPRDHQHPTGVNTVVLSTDDPAIRQVARMWGDGSRYDLRVHEREAQHANAHAQIEDAILHWIARTRTYEEPPKPSDLIVLLHPTSPFRRPETIRACIEAAKASPWKCALTVTSDHGLYFGGRLRRPDAETIHACVEAAKTSPWKVDPPCPYVAWDRDDLGERPRSQDLDNLIREDGCVYVFPIKHLLDTGSRLHPGAVPVVVPWLESLDVNTPLDLEVANALAALADRR